METSETKFMETSAKTGHNIRKVYVPVDKTAYFNS